MKKRLLLQLISLVIGIVFVISGTSKMIDSSKFIGVLYSIGFQEFSYMAPFVSTLEMILGLCFILNFQVKNVAFVIFILTILFTFSFLYSYIFRNIENCWCFGDVINLSPSESITKNLLILIGSFFLWKKSPAIQTITGIKVAILCFFASIGFVLSGYTIDKSLREAIYFNSLEGSLFKETSINYVGKSIKKDKFALFVFSPSCPHCWNATENVKKINEYGIYGDVIGIIPKSLSYKLDNYKSKMKPNFQVFILNDSDINNFCGLNVPQLIFINKGVIAKIYHSSEIPCPQIITGL